MKNLSYYIKEPRIIGRSLLYHFGGRLSDSMYLKLMYYFQTGKKLNLKHPKTFNEKLQWLKLYDRRPEYTTMVDKYAVKDYVANIIGQEYIIPTLGVWDRPEDILWDELPRQFVLKTTHGGGSKGVVICHDKAMFDKEEAIRYIQAAMTHDLYKNFREWPYKGIKHRVIAEKYLSEDGEDVGYGAKNREIKDYKFFCFNGKPLYCGVYSNRWSKMAADYFDMEWTHLPFTRKKIPFSVIVPTKPQNFEIMCLLASKLATGYPHLRVDFYEVNSRVFFGELTFFTASGFGEFDPVDWDEIWGAHINLGYISKNN
jgi:hypothetical protein